MLSLAQNFINAHQYILNIVIKYILFLIAQLKFYAMSKTKITFDELCEIFAKEHPYLIPNRRNVGLYAKKIGYVKMRQTINNVNHCFYVRKEDIK